MIFYLEDRTQIWSFQLRFFREETKLVVTDTNEFDHPNESIFLAFFDFPDNQDFVDGTKTPKKNIYSSPPAKV